MGLKVLGPWLARPVGRALQVAASKSLSRMDMFHDGAESRATMNALPNFDEDELRCIVKYLFVCVGLYWSRMVQTC